MRICPLSDRARVRAVLLSAASCFAWSGVAHSQVAPQPTPADTVPGSAGDQTPQAATATNAGDGATGAVTDIVVTGSRVARPGLTSPTPVTALSNDQLVKASPSTVTEALRTLPALVNTAGPQRNSGTTNGGQSFLDLRSLGPSRTLTLLNGQRFVAGSLNGSVDVNLIPSALIQRVDIVTGGASAAYGSDAVAGVVNFILDTKFQGAKLDGYYGVSQRGDNLELKLAGAYGFSFADDRGHLVVSGEYFRNKGVRPEDRKWSSQGHNYINGPAGGPTLIEAYDVRTIGTYGGMILTGNGGTAAQNASLAGIQFTPSGTAAPYSFGNYRTSTQQIGGDGVDTELVQDLVRPLDRKSFYGHGEYDLTDNVTVFGEALWGNSESKYVTSLNRNQVGNVLTIRPDNAYLPASVKALIPAGVTSLTFLRHSPERGFVYSDNEVTTQRYVGGARGKIGAFKWDGYFQHGRTKVDTDILNVNNVTNLALAIDAVVSPTTGQIVCRSTLTNPTNGCVPINLFGVGAPSAAALDYTRGTSHSTSNLTEDEGQLNISGPIFEGWAGPVSVAVGGEWRQEKAVTTVDALSLAGAYLFGNPQPWSGKYNVKEGYAEIVFPLLRNVSFAKSLELNAAGRVTDYSTSGTIPSWKVGLSYVPVDGLRFRVTRSRDIRAPNVSELFSAGRLNMSSPNDPFKGGATVLGVPTVISGNPTLKPEKANTFTAGVVLQPSFFRGFTASVDYYDIKIKDAIQTVTAQQLVDQCFAGNPLACAQTVRDSNGTLIRLFSVPLNLAELRTTGVDFDFGYQRSVGSLLGDNSRLSLRSVVAYVQRYTNTLPGSAPINTAGQVGLSTIPHWSGTAQATLSSDGASMFLQGRLIGGGKWDVTRTDAYLNFNHISPQFYLDGQISYKLPYWGRRVEAYIDVRNLLDHDPPFAPGNGNLPIATNSGLYDMVGRAFRFGFRVRL